MEICSLTQEEKVESRALYEEVFAEDEKAFVDAYYQIKAKDNVILAVKEGGEIVSMLHRNPYTFRFRGKKLLADYIVAVATKRAFRHQGMMRTLLTAALRDMRLQKRPFTFLMPADEAIYTPFGFRLMGNDDAAELKELSEHAVKQLAEEYDLFVEKDGVYWERHIDWPGWEETPMMIRLVDWPGFAAFFGAEEKQTLFLYIEDPILPENQGLFCWTFEEEESRVMPVEAAAAEVEKAELRLSISDLGSFLCGMISASELPEACFLKEREGVLEKLERIRVLEGIYINETV